jgi:outer membrane protein OmpA-like peptidoglycan-associated protein
MLRARSDQFAGSAIGSEVQLSLAAGARLLEHRLILGPELYTSTVVNDSDAFFSKRGTPLEILLGGHYNVAPDWRVGAGVAPGLTRGYGTPAVRVVLSAEWAPGYTKPERAIIGDRDNDGISDDRDMCPDKAGPANLAQPLTHGCPPAPPPPPPDRDKDGIIDAEDACPDTPGVKTDDPKTNGCPPPPPDRDKDGIVDAEDACPDTPGVKTNDPKTNGCPPPDPDRDKDGIKNEEDACPDEPGEPNPDPKKNGCPKAVVQGGQIKILEQVKFKTGSAEILKDSDAILAAVVKVLNDHPDIKNLMVEGHTDNVGGAAYNKDLSNRRAASVAKWLTTHGIDKARLESKGYGLERPIDDNRTEAGRKNNRRVEFHIEDENKAPKP